MSCVLLLTAELMLILSVALAVIAVGDTAKPTAGGCFSIVVGKDVSSDGFVMMAHNEDDYIPQIVNHHKVARQKHDLGEMIQLVNGGAVEQVEETWSYIWSEIPNLLFSDSYLNEWGVCICSDACPSREDQPDLTGGGISYMLRRIVAERARTAREGVQIAGELIERFGYASSGRTYIISDPDEGWLMAAVHGKHWMAKRVPDDRVALIANTYTIHEIDLADTMNYLGSADMIDYAVERGWYDPEADGEFDFAAAYAAPSVAADERNIGRQWDGIRLLATDPPSYGAPLPFAIVPKGKINVGMITSVLRSHYEGTDLYRTDSLGCPHGNRVTPICRHDTQTSFVAQLRGGMPSDIGLVYWVCLSSPCVSCYVPFYFGMEAFPQSYAGESLQPSEEEHLQRVNRPFEVDSSSAYWTFTHLRYKVERNYPDLAGQVRARFDIMESEARGRQESVEREATAAYADDRIQSMSILSEYTLSVIAETMTVMRQLETGK